MSTANYVWTDNKDAVARAQSFFDIIARCSCPHVRITHVRVLDAFNEAEVRDEAGCVISLSGGVAYAIREILQNRLT